MIRGEVANNLGELEWQHLCEGALYQSKWYAFRIGPGDNDTGTRTDLLSRFDTKDGGIDWLRNEYGTVFMEVF